MLQNVDNVLSDQQRDHIVERIAQMLSPDEQRQLKDTIFNQPNAPVSYPFLWDIPQNDYVQWNGLGANGGLGPVGRNTGEVIGVFGTLDWEAKRGYSIAAVLGGQGLKGT